MQRPHWGRRRWTVAVAASRASSFRMGALCLVARCGGGRTAESVALSLLQVG